MKKQLLLVTCLSGLLFSSCRKHYSCQCSTSFDKTGYNTYTVSSIEKIDSKTTKKTAEKICSQSEKQLKQNDADYISGNEKITVSCAVKL
jgi:hypothetical protein